MSEVIELATRETVVIETPAGSELLVVESEVECEVVEVAEQGPPGTPGATTLVVIQGVPAAVWSIKHDLGKYPSVFCIDSAGDQVEGRVEYPDRNNVVVTYSAATSGEAYLN